MIAEMAADFAVDGTNLYDLGCSTGTTFLKKWHRPIHHVVEHSGDFRAEFEVGNRLGFFEHFVFHQLVFRVLIGANSQSFTEAFWSLTGRIRSRPEFHKTPDGQQSS